MKVAREGMRVMRESGWSSGDVGEGEGRGIGDASN